MQADRPGRNVSTSAETGCAAIGLHQLPAPRHALADRPRGLRATCGTATRSLAAGHLLAQAFVGVISAVGLLALLFTSWTALLAIVQSLEHEDCVQAVLAVGAAVLGGYVILLFSVIPAIVLWLYASVALILLVTLRVQHRLTVTALGVLPFAWACLSQGTRPDLLGAALMFSAAFGALTAHHRVLRLTLTRRQQTGPLAIVVHDGGSSLCQRYARNLPARFLGQLLVCDGRQDAALRTDLLTTGHNPEHGLIVLTANGALQGAHAVRWLAKRTAPGVRWLAADLLFASPLAFVLYPLFRAVRAIQLLRAGLPRLDRISAVA